MRGAAGFSLVELLVASAVMLVVAAAAMALIVPADGTFQTQTEAADAQQRLRVATTLLASDLALAGSGPDRGPLAGPLVQAFAPILPYRRGTSSDDPPGSYFPDRITVLAVPPAGAHSVLAADGPPLDSDWLPLSSQPQCPPTDPLCLFGVGDVVAVYDGSGRVDLLSVTAKAADPVPVLQHANDRLSSAAYRPGETTIVAVTNVSYAFDRAAAQLVVSTGLTGPSAPAVSNVVGLTFAYYGDPQPPQLTTYGPKPPPLDVQVSPEWPPGENCAFLVAGGAQVPRLPVLGGTALVRLSPEQLTDGPWCPDGSSANRWDADLLRVRAVSVTVRVQAAVAALRGPAGALFAVGGSGRDASRWVPDKEVTFRVAPRNLNFGAAP